MKKIKNYFYNTESKTKKKKKKPIVHGLDTLFRLDFTFIQFYY